MVRVEHVGAGERVAHGHPLDARAAHGWVDEDRPHGRGVVDHGGVRDDRHGVGSDVSGKRREAFPSHRATGPVRSVRPITLSARGIGYRHDAHQPSEPGARILAGVPHRWLRAGENGLTVVVSRDEPAHLRLQLQAVGDLHRERELGQPRVGRRLRRRHAEHLREPRRVLGHRHDQVHTGDQARVRDLITVNRRGREVERHVERQPVAVPLDRRERHAVAAVTEHHGRHRRGHGEASRARDHRGVDVDPFPVLLRPYRERGDVEPHRPVWLREHRVVLRALLHDLDVLRARLCDTERAGRVGRHVGRLGAEVARLGCGRPDGRQTGDRHKSTREQECSQSAGSVAVLGHDDMERSRTHQLDPPVHGTALVLSRPASCRGPEASDPARSDLLAGI